MWCSASCVAFSGIGHMMRAPIGARIMSYAIQFTIASSTTPISQRSFYVHVLAADKDHFVCVNGSERARRGRIEHCAIDTS